MPGRNHLLVTPVPQSVDLRAGWHTLRKDRSIILFSDAIAHGLTAAQTLQSALERYAGVRWEIRGASSVAETEGIVAVMDAKATKKRESYHLTIGDERIAVVAHDAAGLAHAFSTLVQLVRQYGRRLPQLHIEDHPDFANRGLMLDISRDKVPTMATVYGLIDMLAEWKINQFQLYMEHTFAYQQHRAVWRDASPFTGEEILALDAYCRRRHIELVPNQNSFGHMARWLDRKPYNDFAEAPKGATVWWGRLPPFSLDPADPRSLRLIDGLYAELLPHFQSRSLNVGCDETFDLGQGKNKADVEKRGEPRVYLDFLLKISELCQKYQHRMMFWGDIIMKEPALISEIPRECIALEWGYEHDHPYDADGRAFASAGLPFYVCPGAGGWISHIGRTDNTIANIQNAVRNGRKHGAIGVLNTEWGDNGHMQPLSVAWLGFMYGAAMSWSGRGSAEMDIAAALSLHAFDDPSGVSGRVAYDLGNAYQINGAKTRNGSLLAQLYFIPLESDWPMHRARAGGFEETSEQLEANIARLSPELMRRCDAQLVVEELRCATELAGIGASIGAAKYARSNGGAASKVRAPFRGAGKRIDALLPEYERLWRARNRPGGMGDSVGRLVDLAAGLKAAGQR